MSMESYLVPRLDMVHNVMDKGLSEFGTALPFALATYAVLRWLSTDEQRKEGIYRKANQACLAVVTISFLLIIGKVLIPTTSEYLDNARKIRLAEKQLEELNKEQQQQQAPAPAQQPAQ